MTGYLWAGLGLLTVLSTTALCGMASEEIRDRLEHIPHAILRLAARRLTPSQRIQAAPGCLGNSRTPSPWPCPSLFAR